MQDFALRPAVPDDLPIFRALFHTSRECEFAHLPWPPELKASFLDSQFNAQTQGYLQAYPKARYFAVVRPDEPSAAIGRLITHIDSSALHVVDIGLLPLHRSLGLGTRILRAQQQEAARSGLIMSLQVDRSNPALRLYQRLGFTICGEDALRFRMQWQA